MTGALRAGSSRLPPPPDPAYPVVLRSLEEAFDGLFPKDNPKNTRFSINFFVSIGLGGLTYVLLLGGAGAGAGGVPGRGQALHDIESLVTGLVPKRGRSGISAVAESPWHNLWNRT